MKPSELALFQRCHQWLAEGHCLYFLTVTKTWGSSPRPVGSLAAICDDGSLLGSVSGGCVEDDLIHRLTHSPSKPHFPTFFIFGDTPETARLIPCQSVLEIFVEKIVDPHHFSTAFEKMPDYRLSRTVDIHSGKVLWQRIVSDNAPLFEKTENTIKRNFENQWKLILFGNTSVSQHLYHFAIAIGFDVIICDPRDGYSQHDEIPVNIAMPDELVLQHANNKRVAFISLSHDPKLDDMALMEALKSNSFYIGAMGSQTNNMKRRERLARLDLTAEQIARLHGPAGLAIKSKTPEEIAISILAQVIQQKNILQQEHF